MNRCCRTASKWGDDFLTKPFSHTVLKRKVFPWSESADCTKNSAFYAQMKKDEEMAEGYSAVR